MNRQHQQVLTTILIVWAIIIVIYGISRYYQLEWNRSTSMPQKLWLTHVGDRQLQRNDYVVFKFHDFRMKNPDDVEYVVKQVGGVAGDAIIVKRCTSYTEHGLCPNKANLIYFLPDGEVYPVFNILSGNHFTPLTNKNLLIPQGCYFVHGQHQPTFDSRYKEFGLVCNNQIYGKSYPLF